MHCFPKYHMHQEKQGRQVSLPQMLPFTGSAINKRKGSFFPNS